jgi:hypothetical protein
MKTVLILSFIAVQVCLPLLYYTRRDPHDERFAWRMFSPMRMARCEPHFQLDSKELVLDTTFHDAWVTLATRGRFVVIEAMAAFLCNKHPGSSLTVTVDCQYLDREAVRYGGYDMCSVPQL